MSEPNGPDRALLICNTFAEGHGVPSDLRTCGSCGTDVWVSREMTPVVDSGEASPICGPCWVVYDCPDEATYALHPRQMAGLAQSQVLDFAHLFITEMNERRQR
jgi:hypothetical protein